MTICTPRASFVTLVVCFIQGHGNKTAAGPHPIVRLHVTHKPLSATHAHCHLEEDTGAMTMLTEAISKCESAHAKMIEATEEEIVAFLVKEDATVS